MIRVAIIAVLIFSACDSAHYRVNPDRCPVPDNLQKNARLEIASDEIDKFMKRTEVEGLRAKDLQKGDLEIRVWTGFNSKVLRGIILQNNGNGSSASLIENLRNIESNSPEFRRLKDPKSGWEHLWENLFRLAICELPDSEDVGLKMDFVHPTVVFIEIRNGDLYRSYSSFGFNEETMSKNSQVRHVYEIIQHLSTEFAVSFFDR